MPMNAQQAALTVLTAFEVPNVYSGVLPSWFTIATFSDDPEKVAALRKAEVFGTVISLGLGAAASVIAESPLPFIATAAMAVVLIVGYEWHIRNPIREPLAMEGGGY